MNLFILRVDVLEARKKGKHRDLSELNKGHLVTAGQLSQSNSKPAVLMGCLQCAVVSIYQKQSKQRTVENQLQSHRWSGLINSHGVQRLARVVQFNRRATEAQVDEKG